MCARMLPFALLAVGACVRKHMLAMMKMMTKALDTGRMERRRAEIIFRRERSLPKSRIICPRSHSSHLWRFFRHGRAGTPSGRQTSLQPGGTALVNATRIVV